MTSAVRGRGNAHEIMIFQAPLCDIKKKYLAKPV